MNFARYLLSEAASDEYEELHEEEAAEEVEFPKDNSGFEEDQFGIDKIDRPSDEGLDAAEKVADQFSDASDGQNTDVDLSLQMAFPEDKSGFEENNEGIANEDLGVDPNTIPAENEEDGQFSDPEEENIPVEDMDPNELADDLDDFDEAAMVGWDDLFG